MTKETENKVVKQATKIDVLKSVLNANSVQDQFKNALQENSGPFVASVIDLYGSDSYLQGCEPKAVVMEALKAAVLKLPINKSLGFAYIIPYKNKGKLEPNFQMGYKGYIQLAMRTGQYRFINADKVYEGEIKERNKLTGWIDFTGEKKSDKVVGYFAHIELLNGFSKTIYMTKEEVTAWGKKYSQSFSHPKGLWKTDFDTMALKTPLKNLLSHYGYLSIEMISAIDNDFNKSPNEEMKETANSDTIDIDSEEVQVDEKPEKKPTEKKAKQTEAEF